jgi:hypothetical protein
MKEYRIKRVSAFYWNVEKRSSLIPIWRPINHRIFISFEKAERYMRFIKYLENKNKLFILKKNK